MLTFAVLFQILSRLALVETPALHDGSEKNAKYLDKISHMTEVYIEASRDGALVSPDADAAMLAIIGYEESRHREKVVDGDCWQVNGARKCHSAGPFQLNMSIAGMLHNIDPHAPAIQIADLRNGHKSGAIAYRLLRFYKQTCHGGPAQWLGAYASGKCSQRPIRLGARRCAMASAILVAGGA
jgi:hypothetical protein